MLSAEALLGRLRAQADRLEHETGEEADRLRRDVIKLLVADVQVQPDATPVVRYRFAVSSNYSAQKSA